MAHTSDPTDDCAGCPLDPGRRAFLRDAAAAAAAALAVLGASPAAALARPLELIAPLGTSAETLTYAIPAADGVTVDRKNEVILARWQGAVYAFNLACPHKNTALRWLPNDGRFQCPKHKSKYRPDGAFISGRATRGMDRFAVRREGASVVVDVDRLYKQTDDPRAWAAAAVRL